MPHIFTVTGKLLVKICCRPRVSLSAEPVSVCETACVYLATCKAPFQTVAICRHIVSKNVQSEKCFLSCLMLYSLCLMVDWSMLFDVNSMGDKYVQQHHKTIP